MHKWSHAGRRDPLRGAGSGGADGYGLLVALDLFAGISVSDYGRALSWYERLFGSPPSFVPHATEAVWELAEHCYVFIEEQERDAGHAQHTVFVDDLDARVGQIARRGLEPVQRETYANGVRKVTYRDPDGNEIGFGGAGDRAG
jgi:predicted enzyme related to lactoylglutathione lyase